MTSAKKPARISPAKSRAFVAKVAQIAHQESFEMAWEILSALIVEARTIANTEPRQ